MYPHERSFVKKVQDKPVVLLGVNSDTEREKLKTVLVKEQITWRSWWGDGPKGQIAKDWQVTAWPTIFIIDAKGIIRAKDDKGEFASHPERLEVAVALVLAGARQEAANPPAKKPKKKEPAATVENVPTPVPTAKKLSEGSNDDEQRAASKLGFAKQLAEANKTERAKERCLEIIKNYPHTTAAADAKKLLETLDK